MSKKSRSKQTGFDADGCLDLPRLLSFLRYDPVLSKICIRVYMFLR